MKKIAILIAAALAAASCWRVDEDRSLCVGTPLILRFDADAGSRATSQGPQNIDAFLFDADGGFVDSRHVSGGVMQAEFFVPQGVYHAVCWANVGDNRTAIYRNPTLHQNFVNITSTERGTELWYAPGKAPAFENIDLTPHRIVVDSDEEMIADFTFSKAHRTVEVYAVGFELVRADFAPTVEYSGACGRYDFMLQADPEPMLLRQTMSPDLRRQDNVFVATFTSMLHPMTGSEQVMLVDPAKDVELGKVNLTEFVAENQIDDDSNIEVAFIYNDLTGIVSVQMPRWSDNPIKPGL
jgi:hypothetical protein